MPIISSDIKYRLSGGSANADPLLSIGGVASSVDAAATIFDDVSSAEAVAGDTEYRCVYVRNTHATLTMLGTKIWVQTQTPSADTAVEVALGSSAVSGTETGVANENTAPSGPTFSSPTNEAGGLTIGDLAPAAHKAVWFKRIVTAGAASASDSFTIRVKCDTNP